MNKLVTLMLLLIITVAVNAQESRPQVPAPKNVLNIKKPQLPDKPIQVQTNFSPVATVLTSNTWNLIRWWTTGDVGHSDGDPAFKFNSNGTVSCSFWIADAGDRFESGSYTLRNNNINIQLKKGSNMQMDCNLVYNKTDRTITGSYTLKILPVTNPPAGYTPGTITGDMKLTIKP